MASIYFSLSAKLFGGKKQVMVRFGATKVNQRAKTGIYVNPTYWDDATMTVAIPKPRLITDGLQATIKELREADSQLRELKLFIEDEYLRDTTSPANNPNWLKEVVYVFHNGIEDDHTDIDFWGAWDLFISTKVVSEQRHRMYVSTRNILKRFEAVKRKKNLAFHLDLHTFSPLLISEFEKYLYEEPTYVSKYPDIFEKVRISDGRGGISRGANTVSGRLDIFNTFYRWANDKELTTNYPFKNFHIKSVVYGTPIYITKEERNILLAANMGTESLERVRDIFVFQCCIGCRVGDMLKFTKDNIIDGAIEYIARKTKDKRPHTVRVPLTKIALDIIEKYKDDNRKELLPFISKQKYNDYIKMCFEKAELTRLITVLDPRTRTNVQMRLCDFVTSHTARKTFISILYEQVQDPNLIGVLSGHVEGSKAFAQYRHIDEERKRKTIELLE